MTTTTPAPSWALEEVADGIVAFIGGGEPNIGAIIGRDAVLAIDGRATPDLAGEWLSELSAITSKPVRWVFLTHYHAVRVMGASRFGADFVIAHAGTARWLRERGPTDLALEIHRFPRLFEGLDPTAPHPVPNITFADELCISLGDRDVHLSFYGLGHTAGDAVAWVPDQRVLFAGDLVEASTVPYCGDAFIEQWATTTLDRLAALAPRALVPGRGPVVYEGAVAQAVHDTRSYLQMLQQLVGGVVLRGGNLTEAYSVAREGLLPSYGDLFIFDIALRSNVLRAFEEASGRAVPSLITVERDRELHELMP